MVKLTIDGCSVAVEKGKTVLDAARLVGVAIPTLCYLKEINEIGACRMCVVEIEGKDQLVASCNTEAEEGMVVHTRSQKVLDTVTVNLELILANHRAECTTCDRSTSCELQQLAKDFRVKENSFVKRYPPFQWDAGFPLQRDDSKCIKCMRCVAICSEVQGCNVWEFTSRGFRSNIEVKEGKRIQDAGCSLCGQCITHCPVGALNARDDINEVFAALNDPEIITVANVAPAVRTAWADDFDIPAEKATVGRMVGTLKRMGFDYVFDTNFSADLTIMEEANEFLERFTHKEEHEWPMFTSCCPGWVRYLEHYHPDMLHQLSSAKSPQQMFGAVVKTYFAQKLGVDPARIFYASLMPCVAKKDEAADPDFMTEGRVRDIDAVLTVRELALAVKMKALNPGAIEEASWDEPFGDASGAGVIFGTSGGVCEAALRSAHYFVTGKNPVLEPLKVRDLEKGWQGKTIHIGDVEIKVAVVSGLKNTENLIAALKAGEVQYDFVEVMACPGGCAGGGGQTIRINQELAPQRGKMLSSLDEAQPIRFSHENPVIKEIYEEFLGEPLSPLAKKILHAPRTLALHEEHEAKKRSV